MLKESLLGWGGVKSTDTHKYILDKEYVAVVDYDETYGTVTYTPDVPMYAWTSPDLADDSQYKTIYTKSARPDVGNDVYTLTVVETPTEGGQPAGKIAIPVARSAVISCRSYYTSLDADIGYISTTTPVAYTRDTSLDDTMYEYVLSSYHYMWPANLDGSYSYKEYKIMTSGLFRTWGQTKTMSVWIDQKTQEVVVFMSANRSSQLRYCWKEIIATYQPNTFDLLDYQVFENYSSANLCGPDSRYSENIYNQVAVNTTDGVYAWFANGFDKSGNRLSNPRLYLYYPEFHQVQTVDFGNPSIMDIDANSDIKLISVNRKDYSNYTSYVYEKGATVTFSITNASTNTRRVYYLKVNPSGSTEISYTPLDNSSYRGVTVANTEYPVKSFASTGNTYTGAALFAATNSTTVANYNVVRNTSSFYTGKNITTDVKSYGEQTLGIIRDKLLVPDYSGSQLKGNIKYVTNLNPNDTPSSPVWNATTLTLKNTNLQNTTFLRVYEGGKYCEEDAVTLDRTWIDTAIVGIGEMDSNNKTFFNLYYIVDYYKQDSSSSPSTVSSVTAKLLSLYSSKDSTYRYTNVKFESLIHGPYSMVINSRQYEATAKYLPVIVNILRPNKDGSVQLYCLDLRCNENWNEEWDNAYDDLWNEYYVSFIVEGETAVEDRTLTLDCADPNYTIEITANQMQGYNSPAVYTNENTISLPIGTVVNYSVSMTGYITQSGSVTLTEDITIPISLYTDPTPMTLTINPVPADATVTLTSTGVTPVSGTGPQTITVMSGQSVNYEVSKTDFDTVTGSVTVNNNLSMNVPMEIPLTEVYNSNGATGNYSTTIDSKYNYIEIEFAGAKGSPCSHNEKGTPGKGAIRKITAGLTNYTISGIIGKAAGHPTAGTGYQNGGAGTSLSGTAHYSGGGGGSTSVVYNNTTATAGGGSGVALVTRQGFMGSTSYKYYSAKSGAGGGPNGGAAVSPAASSSGYSKANGSIGSADTKYYNGKNAANTDAIGYNNGNGYVKIKAGWKADYA